MQRTIFEMPGVSTLLRGLARLLLWSAGWRTAGGAPSDAKYVMVAAPHTSNWDLPLTLMIALVFRVPVFWMGKDSLFRWPFGGFFRWLGGVPIDRTKSNQVVAQMVQTFQRARSFVLVVAPEGTRKRVAYWKTGFYHIAVGAGVPIVLGFLDYRRKVGGIGPTVSPDGDLANDMKTIRGFYDEITGKHATESGVAAVVAEP